MNARRQSGFSMMEVLVTIAIVVVGLLGMVGLQTRATLTEMESYQRAQALILLQGMTDRLSVNKPNAASYVANNVGSGGATQDCSAVAAGAARDLCEWGNALVGAAETSGARNVGAMIGARGCITSPAANLYVFTVAWQGMVPTATPSEDCGRNAYGDDRQRRTVSMVIRVATLNAP